MASKLGLSRKREQANERIERATNRLAHRGVNVGSFPAQRRDPDVLEVERLVYTADLLEATVDRLDESREEFKALTDQVAALDAALAAATKEPLKPEPFGPESTEPSVVDAGDRPAVSRKRK